MMAIPGGFARSGCHRDSRLEPSMAMIGKCQSLHIDADGNRVLSQRIPNDEAALLELIANVLKLGDGEEAQFAGRVSGVSAG